jgi:hypothetical protein
MNTLDLAPLEILLSKYSPRTRNRIDFGSMGHNAFYHNVDSKDNPFPLDSKAGKSWDNGWWAAWEGWQDHLNEDWQ